MVRQIVSFALFGKPHVLPKLNFQKPRIMMLGHPNISTSFILGYLRDISGTYVSTYIFCGVSTSIASVIFFSGRFVGFKKAAKSHTIV